MDSHRTLPMSLSDIMAAIPIDENLIPGDHGITFTIDNADALFGDAHVPAYRDPSHLGAWLVGYWTAQQAHNNDEKES